MTIPVAKRNREEIRQSIGYILDSVIVSEVSSTAGDTTSLIDTYGLAKGGDNDYKGRQVMITGPTGSIAAREKSFVASFASTGDDATLAPAFTANLTKGDDYEMWDGYIVEQVESEINSAIRDATDDVLQDKEDTTLIKLENTYEYTIPTGFVALHKVEYEYGTEISHLLDDCEDVWTAGITATTVTADSSMEKVGSYCVKSVVTAAAITGDILCYEDIDSVDISDCDKVEFWMYSSIALTAGQLDFMLDSVAACAGTPTESIDIPAMTAATWYKHSLSLANPHSDTKIISIGVKQISDVGAFTFYIDEVRAILDNSRIYRELNPDFWGVLQASTPLLKLSEDGYGAISNNKWLRLRGYQIPAEFGATDDTTDCEIDSDYVVYAAASNLLMSKAGSREIDPEDRYRRAAYFRQLAERRLAQGKTHLAMNTRFVSR